MNFKKFKKLYFSYFDVKFHSFLNLLNFESSIVSAHDLIKVYKIPMLLYTKTLNQRKE